MLKPKTQNLIAMLGSDNAGERANAALMLKKALKDDEGMDFHDLARGVKVVREVIREKAKPEPKPEPEARSPREWRLQRDALMARGARVYTRKEWDFLTNLSDWRGSLTERQANWLTALALREGVFV